MLPFCVCACACVVALFLFCFCYCSPCCFFVFATQLICKTSAGNISCHPLSWAQFLPALRSRSLSALSQLGEPNNFRPLSLTHTHIERQTHARERRRESRRERGGKSGFITNFNFVLLLFLLCLCFSLSSCACFGFASFSFAILFLLLLLFCVVSFRTACRRRRGSKAEAQMKTKLQNAPIICSQGKSGKE